MWPVYERICRVFRASVDGQPFELGARTVVADEMRGLVAITATVVELMPGVGSSLVRVDGSRLPIATLNALLGLPPAYRKSNYKIAREWLAFWANGSFHWRLMQRVEQALADDTATDVAAALPFGPGSCRCAAGRKGVPASRHGTDWPGAAPARSGSRSSCRRLPGGVGASPGGDHTGARCVLGVLSLRSRARTAGPSTPESSLPALPGRGRPPPVWSPPGALRATTPARAQVRDAGRYVDRGGLVSPVNERGGRAGGECRPRQSQRPGSGRVASSRPCSGVATCPSAGLDTWKAHAAMSTAQARHCTPLGVRGYRGLAGISRD